MKIDRFILQRVQYMPGTLEPGILYVAEQYGTAAHLCACGCGAKIRTPLGPDEWSFAEMATGPSLSPSVVNWQQADQAHKWIVGGQVEWAGKWSEKQVAAGRGREEERRRAYYDCLNPPTWWQRFWRWLKSLFKDD